MVRTNATNSDFAKLYAAKAILPVLTIPATLLLTQDLYSLGVVFILSLIWYRFGLIWLCKCGLDKVIFGMELIHGCDKTFLIWGPDEAPIIGTCIKMQRPADLDLFRKKLHDHFMQFTRLKSQLVILGSSYFFKELTERRVLNRLVEIWPDEMDEQDIQLFMARKLASQRELFFGLPLF